MNAKVVLGWWLIWSATVGTGCKPMRDRIREALAISVATDAAWASNVCGYQVQGLTSVSVTSVQHAGSAERGTGSATVAGTPVAAPGMPVTPTCGATVTFNYAAGAGDTPVERLTSADLHVSGLLVTGRLAALPSMVPLGSTMQPNTVPAATANPSGPTAMAPGPQAPSAGACGRYQTCCVAASALPGMQGLAASCAQIGGLASMGVYGQQACTQAWDSLHRAMARMPNTPAACR